MPPGGRNRRRPEAGERDGAARPREVLKSPRNGKLATRMRTARGMFVSVARLDGGSLMAGRGRQCSVGNGSLRRSAAC